jgi:hypothetical protein
MRVFLGGWDLSLDVETTSLLQYVREDESFTGYPHVREFVGVLEPDGHPRIEQHTVHAGADNATIQSLPASGAAFQRRSEMESEATRSALLRPGKVRVMSTAVEPGNVNASTPVSTQKIPVLSALVLDVIPSDHEVAASNAEHFLSQLESMVARDGAKGLTHSAPIKAGANALHSSLPDFLQGRRQPVESVLKPDRIEAAGSEGSVVAAATRVFNAVVKRDPLGFPIATVPLQQSCSSSFIPIADSEEDTALRNHALLQWLANPASFTISDPSPTSPFPVMRAPKLPLIDASATLDFGRALLHRCLSGLSNCSSIAFRDRTGKFPFVRAAQVAVAAVLGQQGQKDLLTSALGLLRNISCLEKSSLALEIVRSGGLEACIQAYFGPVRPGRPEFASADEDPNSLQNAEELVMVANWEAALPADERKARCVTNRARLSALRTLWNTDEDGHRDLRCEEAILQLWDPSVTTASTVVSSGGVRGCRWRNVPAILGGEDAKVAMDAVLTASNLLRFDAVQKIGNDMDSVAVSRLAGMAVDILRRFTDCDEHLGLHEEALKMLRYLQEVADVDPNRTPSSISIVAVGTVGAISICLSQHLNHWDAILNPASPNDQSEANAEKLTTVSNLIYTAMRVLCYLLLNDRCRTTALCPYKFCAEVIVSTMSRPALQLNDEIQVLGANLLRNLACVTIAKTTEGASSTSSSPTKAAGGNGTAAAASMDINQTSPALVVSIAGAPQVLEGAMERFPENKDIQENGRCALYNLLLLGSSDARVIYDRLSSALQDKSLLESRLSDATAATSVALDAATKSRMQIAKALGMTLEALDQRMTLSQAQESQVQGFPGRKPLSTSASGRRLLPIGEEPALSHSAQDISMFRMRGDTEFATLAPAAPADAAVSSFGLGSSFALSGANSAASRLSIVKLTPWKAAPARVPVPTDAASVTGASDEINTLAVPLPAATKDAVDTVNPMSAIDILPLQVAAPTSTSESAGPAISGVAIATTGLSSRALAVAIASGKAVSPAKQALEGQSHPARTGSFTLKLSEVLPATPVSHPLTAVAVQDWPACNSPKTGGIKDKDQRNPVVAVPDASLRAFGVRWTKGRLVGVLTLLVLLLLAAIGALLAGFLIQR